MEIPRKRAVEQYLSELPSWLLAASIVVPVLLGIVGYIFPIPAAPANTRLFLSALAGSQASVLAIVFSVTLLGIQLATTRYATRMIPLFVKSPIFKFTLAVFLVSISVDFIVLYNLPTATTPASSAAVYFASGAAIVSAITLTVYIPRILYRGTPDGLIEAFEDSLHYDAYRRKTKAFTETSARADHPMQPLHALTMSALSRREWATAERGLDGFENIGYSVIPQLTNSGEDRRESPLNESKELFKMPLQDFLTEITIHAFENDEKELVREAISVQEQIGNIAFDNYYHYITMQTVGGLTKSVQESPPTIEGNSIRRPAFKASRRLLKKFAERPSPHYIWRILGLMDHQVSVLFRKDAEKWIYDHFLLGYYNGTLLEVQEDLLGFYSTYIDSLDVDWRQQYPHDDDESYRLLEVFFKWREVFVNTTLYILRYRERNDDYPITYGNFFSSWQRACSAAIESDASDYAEVMCELFIEFAFIGRFVDNDSYRTWVTRFASVKEDHPEVVDSAFDNLRAEGRTGLVHYYSEQSQESSALTRLVQRMMGSANAFDEWMVEFEEDVDQAYEERISRDAD